MRPEQGDREERGHGGQYSSVAVMKSDAGPDPSDDDKKKAGSSALAPMLAR